MSGGHVHTDKRGGKSIELLLPVDHMGKSYSVIELAPVKWEHTLRWRQGKFASSMALLAELSGMPETALHEITYPDVNRVLTQFMEMLPDEIRSDIAEGKNPSDMSRLDEPVIPDASLPVDDIDPAEMATPPMAEPQHPEHTPPQLVADQDAGLGFEVDEQQRTGTNG